MKFITRSLHSGPKNKKNCLRKPNRCVHECSKIWSGKMHFLSTLTYLWCRLTEIEATESLTPTYLPLCDVQISHLSSKLAQPPQNNCWHDNSEEWNESSRDTTKVEQTKHEGTSVFSTGTHSSTCIDTPKQVSNHDMFCSVHAEERVPAGGGVCSRPAHGDLECVPAPWQDGEEGQNPDAEWQAWGQSRRAHPQLIPWLSVGAEGWRWTAVRVPRHGSVASRPSAEVDSQSINAATVCITLSILPEKPLRFVHFWLNASQNKLIFLFKGDLSQCLKSSLNRFNNPWC